MAFFQFQKEQLVDTSVDVLWDFITSPHNLKRITPPNMGFDILTEDLPSKIYAGLIISYIVRPMFGIKTNWVTEITHVEDNKYFVDEQRIGPYAMWHHQHHIAPLGDKTVMKDIISYQPPFGILGNLINRLFIRKKLQQIFYYRAKVISKFF